jgi:hypothetical protein
VTTAVEEASSLTRSTCYNARAGLDRPKVVVGGD